ncbi:restriction endonuclease subunit S [Acinetobacter sp. 5862]|uniref:restriction endonuclease subunit S n=1 Tax=Acinetobacter sp. 5862 TaxID=2967169 RepID=UPI002111203B|nr:restriction endonuclease subunit S [Acinetobacter sp. 5862]
MSVPKLRFKEFDGDWTTSPLKALCKINQGLQIAIEDRFLEDGNNRYFYITNEFLKEGSKKAYFIENPPKAVICDESDILMTRTGNTGQVVTDVKGAFHNNFFKIDFDRSIINKNFFIEFLKKDTTQHLILKYAGASTIPDLNHSDFYRIVMPITTIEEQTKIASFLSAVDEKISQLTQKHELLSQYKQGMMQKLFSQQIRFKADDGSEFGEWENLKIFDLAIDKTLNNGVFNDQNKVGKGYKLINVLDMYINRDIDESRLKLLDLSTKDFEKNKVYYGDIFFTRSSLVKEGIAFSNVYLGNSNDVTYDGHLIKLSPNLNRVNPIFLNYILKTHVVRKQLIKGGKTATMTTIGQQEVGNTIVSLPCLEEQTKIANFLSSIDQKIEVVAQQIEQAKQWKKGLLQQMFV